MSSAVRTCSVVYLASVVLAVSLCSTDLTLNTTEELIQNSTTASRQVSCGGSFKCESGQCIDNNQVCDGNADCLDSSDETETVCQPLTCPIHFFKCAYGACINDSAICDGEMDCVDGSDENVSSCSTTSNCLSDEFQCGSGQCIKESSVCDGKRDCIDGSDETDIECKNRSCDPLSFRCSYGACIDGSGKCNGKAQCADSSDEDPKLCKTCIIPKQLKFGTFVINRCEVGDNSSECLAAPGTRVREPALLKLICKTGYHTTGYSRATCSNGKWNPPVSKCVPGPCGIVISSTSEPSNGMAEIPWNALIYKLNSLNGKYEPFCSGTLIGHNLVATAAHCVWDETKQNTFPIDTIKLGFGKYFRSFYVPEPGAQFAEPKELKINVVSYKEDSQLISDIALIVLNISLDFTRAVRPVCIDWYSQYQLSDGETGEIAHRFNSTTQTVNREEMTHIQYQKCLNIVQGQDSAQQQIHSDKFCASVKNGAHICREDSGTSFTFQRNRVRYAAGILASGINITYDSCLSKYGVFYDLSERLNFLRSSSPDW